MSNMPFRQSCVQKPLSFHQEDFSFRWQTSHSTLDCNHRKHISWNLIPDENRPEIRSDELNQWSLEFFLNVFTEFSEFREKNNSHYTKRTRTCYHLCKRPGCYHSASETHVRDRIFKLIPIHASVIYQFPWIRWIHWIQWKFRSI